MPSNNRVEQATAALHTHINTCGGVYTQELIAELSKLSTDEFKAYLEFSNEIETTGFDKSSGQQVFDYIHNEIMVRITTS